MYANWMFFRVTLDMLEMVFAKADPRVVRMYEQRLVDPALHGLGHELLAKFDQTERALLQARRGGGSGWGAGGGRASSHGPALAWRGVAWRLI
jgi:hypothetical protein